MNVIPLRRRSGGLGTSRPTIFGHAGCVTLPLRRQAADLWVCLCTLHCCFFLRPFIFSFHDLRLVCQDADETGLKIVRLG